VSEDQLIADLRAAAAERERADILRRGATAELHERIFAAHAGGVSVTRIAQEAGLSRQSVYELLEPQRPS
jgi:DNA invertase Pin-like site-specific DNA recombinase